MREDEAPRRWQSQLPTGGNNIPESHLRRFGLRGSGPDHDHCEPVDSDLARFIREQL